MWECAHAKCNESETSIFCTCLCSDLHIRYLQMILGGVGKNNRWKM